MSYVQALVPPEHVSNHLLVLPDATEVATVRRLAESWFSDARWLKEPEARSGPQPMRGARFRGMAAAAPDPRDVGPGVLGIGAEHGVAGPFTGPAEVAAQLGMTGPVRVFALGRVDGTFDRRGPRPASPDDRDGVARAFAAGLPEDDELRLVQWGVAVARKLGGLLLADGRELLRPDPAGSVDLRLFSANPIGAADLLALLRSVVATAEHEAETPEPDGSTSHRLVARTPYDGSIVLDAWQVDRVPRALVDVDVNDYGPFAVEVRWVPQDPYELRLEQPSGVHVIARNRMRATVARLALLMHARSGGVLVDDGAFVATTAEVDRRVDEERSPTRAWV
ncbi:hypothetical protein [Isoptericola sp. b408]|uniref:hypothetical protein n=1 Tax=Isoptericola sp. b408 TaxID=3064653 RepID=UPI0027122CFC|nr:hypothetical protein [Isoptericola sp. b408]MDO8150331.1 hypothetical protein [Isoptericola sp. b408]